MTNEFKIELYRCAAALIQEKKVSGICLGLQMAHESMTSKKIHPGDMRNHFPELYAHRPTGALWNFYWWHVMDSEPRLTVINKIIEFLTKDAANINAISGGSSCNDPGQLTDRRNTKAKENLQ